MLLPWICKSKWRHVSSPNLESTGCSSMLSLNSQLRVKSLLCAFCKIKEKFYFINNCAKRELHILAPGSVGFPREPGSCVGIVQLFMRLLGAPPVPGATWLRSLFPGRSMGSACAHTTRPGTTVRNVLRSTTTSLGSQEMGKQGHQMNAEVSGKDFTDPGSRGEHSP